MKRVEKVLLVNAGTDGAVASIANDGTFPALGVVSLATVLLRDHPYMDVIAIDGQITPMEEIEQLISDFQPDVLGVSVLGTSYLNTLRLVEAGKNVQAVTIIGNDHAARLSREILARREAVDYVCGADVGEFALSLFVDVLDGKMDISSVPGLVYRSRGAIVSNDHLPEIPASLMPAVGGALLRNVLDAIPIPDRSLMPAANWKRYLENYLARYGKLHDGEPITGVTTMNRARGCARVKAPCNFCSISDLSLRFSFSQNVLG